MLYVPVIYFSDCVARIYKVSYGLKMTLAVGVKHQKNLKKSQVSKTFDSAELSIVV